MVVVVDYEIGVSASIFVVVRLVVNAGRDGFGRGIVALHGTLEAEVLWGIDIDYFVEDFVESATEKDCAFDECKFGVLAVCPLQEVIADCGVHYGVDKGEVGFVGEDLLG